MLASVALISTGPWPRSGPITPSAKITSRRTEGKREAKLSDVQANQNLQAAPEGAPLGCKPLHGPGSQRLDLPTHFSLGRGHEGVCNRVAHLPARPVGFGSLGHQKALPPSFLLFSGL